MKNNFISIVKDRLKVLPKLSEENIKSSIVVEVLKTLGYDWSMFDFESYTYSKKGRTDIAIKIDHNRLLYVECKRGDERLSERDIIQIAKYLNEQGLEWGLLTNGNEYILLNNKIIVDYVDNQFVLQNKVVFYINILDNTGIEYIEFLSNDAIFGSQTSNYFKDIAQFKACKFPLDNKSWNAYKGTLSNFFMFYSKQEKKYRPLKEIRVDDFVKFLTVDKEEKTTLGKSVNSEDTLLNKYSHIRSMFNELKSKGYLGSHNFDEPRAKLLERFEGKTKKKGNGQLKETKLLKALGFLQKSSNSARNTAIFLLCVYLGMDRKTLSTLRWSMIDLHNSCISIDVRKIPLPPKIIISLKELAKENKERGTPNDYLFYALYKGKYKAISESGINAVFDSLKEIDSSDQTWRLLCPQYIRNSLIPQLFTSGYRIEDIIYLTGLDLVNLAKYLPYHNICEVISKGSRPANPKHPFHSMFY